MKNLRFYIGEVKDAVQSGYERIKAWWFELTIDVAYWWRTRAYTIVALWRYVIKFKWIIFVLCSILSILSIAYLIR